MSDRRPVPSLPFSTLMIPPMKVGFLAFSICLGKELRLKQQYFFVSATLQDVIKKFKRLNLPWSEFPKRVFPTAFVDLLALLPTERYSPLRRRS